MAFHQFSIPMTITINGEMSTEDAHAMVENILDAIVDMAVQDSMGTDVIYDFRFGKITKKGGK